MITIIIPTVKIENLKPCVESIKQYTDLDKVRLLVVANGAKKEMRDYLDSDKRIQYIWFDEMIGYPRAINAGIKARGIPRNLASTDHVILLNDDVILLQQPKNLWIKMLVEPIDADPTVGITGPIAGEDSFAVFFCVMINQLLIDKIGLLDENFGVGAGEDADYSIRAKKAGFKVVQVPAKDRLPSKDGICVGGFPIYHKGEGTVHDTTYVKNWVENCNKNCDYLETKHGPQPGIWHKFDLKLNLGCGPKNWHMKGYTNVDLVDPDADINCDARDLSRFKDGSCSEVVASHLVEHFNPYELPKIFAEWYRVLKPGGKLIMELPDIYQCCKDIVEQIDKKTGKEWIWLACIYGAFPDKSEMQHLYGWHMGARSAIGWGWLQRSQGPATAAMAASGGQPKS
jgi:hypothetical protein